VIAYLRKAGFVVKGPEPSPSRYTSSKVLWRASRREAEQVILAYLNGLPPVVDRRSTKGVDVAVVIGPDFQGIDF
jgi:hypothetical protein